MFGSQALETAIGFALMFFVLAFTASSAVEFLSQILSKRAKNLEQTIASMLSGQIKKPTKLDAAARQEYDDALRGFKATSVYRSAQVATKKWLAREAKPSYLSAKAFADAVGEMLAHATTDARTAWSQLPTGLRTRLDALGRQPVQDAEKYLLSVKSGLEQWFDDTMARLQGAYKRWTAVILFMIGLGLAVGANASAFSVADRLWKEPAVRTAVANSAQNVAKDGNADDLGAVAKKAGSLTELKIPVGWDVQARKPWSHGKSGSIIATIAGWIVTALLVSLGAPFWFDVLTRLASLRNTGAKPALAADDPGSSTSKSVDQASATPAAAPLAAVATVRDVQGQPPAPPPADVPTRIAVAFGIPAFAAGAEPQFSVGSGG